MECGSIWLTAVLVAVLSVLLLQQVVQQPCRPGVAEISQVYRRRCGRHYDHQER